MSRTSLSEAHIPVPVVFPFELEAPFMLTAGRLGFARDRATRRPGLCPSGVAGISAPAGCNPDVFFVH